MTVVTTRQNALVFLGRVSSNVVASRNRVFRGPTAFVLLYLAQRLPQQPFESVDQSTRRDLENMLTDTQRAQLLEAATAEPPTHGELAKASELGLRRVKRLAKGLLSDFLGKTPLYSIRDIKTL